MNHHDVENRLRRLPRPSAPSGLRRRVLAAAEDAVTVAPGSRGRREREPGVVGFALAWAAVLTVGVALHAAATDRPRAGAGRPVGEAAVLVPGAAEPVRLVESLVREDDPRLGGTDLVDGLRGTTMEILR